MKSTMKLGEKLIAFNQQISQFENSIKTETDKVSPLREKNIENLIKNSTIELRITKSR